ncbi:hypothetical protein OTU49_009154, partial [Cherax quadricarinatus]
QNMEDNTPPHYGRVPLWNFTVFEAHYFHNNFPDPMDIGYIAQRLEIDPLDVHIWFKERRKQHILKLEGSKHEGLEGEESVSSQRSMSKMCSTCDAAFICHSDLIAHEEMHKSSWARACKLCGKQYSNLITLETHSIRHGIKVGQKNEQNSQSKYISSTGAPLSDSQLKVLDTHYEHNNFPGTTEVWLVAKRLNLKPQRVRYWFQTKRRKDRRSQKMETKSSCVCSRCGAGFISEFHLENHKKLHRSKQRFPCTQCKAVFISSTILETHQLNHDLISGSKIVFRKLPDGAKDPLTLGQAKPWDILEKNDSEGSDLEIDEGINMEQEIISAVKTIMHSPESDEEETTHLLKTDTKVNTDNVDSKLKDMKLPEHYDKDVSGKFRRSNNNMPDCLENAQKDFKHDLKEIKDTQGFADGALCKTEMEGSELTTVEVGESKSIITKEKTTRLPDKKAIREEVFFDDVTDSDDDDDDDEPRLKIVSAYTISPDTEDLDLEEEES